MSFKVYYDHNESLRSTHLTFYHREKITSDEVEVVQNVIK